MSSEFAEWALKDYPGDLCDVAGAALRVSPEATIPRLLAASGWRNQNHKRVGEASDAHSLWVDSRVWYS